MSKTILVTGATDGIGLATAKMLVEQGHHVLLHGRNPAKVADVEKTLSTAGGNVESYVADLSNLDEVEALAKSIADKHDHLDVLINNAGIFKTSEPVTADGLDVRFVVNTVAPYLLTQRLLPLMDTQGRVVNLSSAAQAPVDLDALSGKVTLGDDFSAYAQSKLAITMWSTHIATALQGTGPIVIPVNPGSLLASKMVKEAFGQSNGGVEIGAEVLVRAALSDEFASANGKYFDNDSRQFASPHHDALDAQKSAQVVDAIEAMIS